MQILCEGHQRVPGVSAGGRFFLHRPEILPEPVLAGGSFADACGASIYGSVLRDGGRFRMWYQAWPRDWDGRDSLAVACAESDDGHTWRRPAYGLLERGGSRANHLTDLPFHAPSVVVDPDGGAERRYRAFGYTDPARVAGRPLPATGRGYYTAFSADGVKWTVEPGPLWPRSDVITACWDPWYRDGGAAHGGVAAATASAHRVDGAADGGTAAVGASVGAVRIALKNNGLSHGQYRRRFYTSQWHAGRVTAPVSAFVADETDDLVARSRGCASADFYGVSWIPTPGPTLAAVWVFRHQHPLGQSAERLWTYGNRGQVDLALFYQLEPGGRWLQLPGRPDWLAAGQAPAWAGGGLYGAAAALDVGDQTWLYVAGTQERHGWAGQEVGLEAYRAGLVEAGGFARIGLVKWPRNRLMGYRAGLCEWVHLLAGAASPDEPEGLRLNAATSRRGRIRAALLDGDYRPLSGYAFTDCDGLSGDHLDAPVTWRGDRRLPDRAAAADLVARVEIDDGALYAFSFARGA